VSQTWEQFGGQVVDGNFPLLQWLGGSESGAVFLTERHDGDRIVKAAIKLIPAPENSELQLSRWRQAAGLAPAHLIRLFEMGKCEVGGTPLLYLVMESAEENLAQVLSHRALTPAETRAVLEPLLDILGYLHTQGLVHGHIKPANIMAIGDELKLSSDGLLRTGESAANTLVPQADAYAPPESLPGSVAPVKGASSAGDVWSLGMTLVEVLTQHLPVRDAAGQGDPELPPDLPEPFLDVARHCLVRNPEDRWTLTQIAARLENLSPVREIRPAAGPAQAAVRPQAMPVKRNSYAVPIAIGAIGVLLAAILLVPKLFRRNSETPQAPVAARQEPVSQPASSPREPLMTEKSAEKGPALRPAADGTAPGEVVERVLPDVPKSARDTIQGTVKVTVRVDVDPSGEVQFAELQNRGPSKYFATLAMQAAQHWGFRPPKVSGQNILSTWSLRFEFTRAGTTVIPTQEIP